MDRTKKELGAYLQDKRMIKEKEEELEELITKATKITNEISGMPKGSTDIQDRMAQIVTQIMDLKNKKNDEIIQMYKTKETIEDNIDKLEQPYKNILYLKYIKGLSLAEVADKVKYDYDYTRKMHGIALRKFKNITQKVLE